MLDIAQKILDYEPKAKDITFGMSEDEEYFLVKYKKGNKKHEISMSATLFELATAEVDKKYGPTIKAFQEEVAEATKDIKAKYEDDLNAHAEEKTRVADEYVGGRIDLHFNPEEDGTTES